MTGHAHRDAHDPGPFVEVANSPMVVVTTAVGTERGGCLVGFHTQCSIDPPLYAVLISKVNNTYEIALRSSALAVNLLGSDQLDLARLFGGHTADDGVDKFDQCDWRSDDSGVPLLDGALGWIVGPVIERHDLGDHVLHVLGPRSVTTNSGDRCALRFRDVAGLDPGHPN